MIKFGTDYNTNSVTVGSKKILKKMGRNIIKRCTRRVGYWGYTGGLQSARIAVNNVADSLRPIGSVVKLQALIRDGGL